jgi:uracil-DNA glycosylase
MWDVIVRSAARMPSWLPVFQQAQAELKTIAAVLDADVARYGRFYPLKDNLFKAFELTPLDQVRVVIVGQDPYPQLLSNGLPRAQGLSFSISREDVIPSSLQNIYKELAMEFPDWTIPKHGDLTQWAAQGVLMLNVCLTCPQRGAGEHAKYGVWMPFIAKVLAAIKAVRPNCIYVMWGTQAQKLAPKLSEQSIQLMAAHPSGLSASRGFFGCNHFKLINQHLVKAGETPIQW